MAEAGLPPPGGGPSFLMPVTTIRRFFFDDPSPVVSMAGEASDKGAVPRGEGGQDSGHSSGAMEDLRDYSKGGEDDGLDSLSYRELKKIARREGLPMNKSAAELRDRIRASRSQTGQGGALGDEGGHDRKKLKTGGESKKVAAKKPMVCPTCYDDIEDPEEGIKLNRCGKTVHKTCLQRALTDPIITYHRSELRCPVCNKHNLSVPMVKQALLGNPGLMKAWDHARLNTKYGLRLIPCPEPDCDHYHILTDKEVSRRPRTLELACGHTIETTADRKAKHEKMMVKSAKGVRKINQCPWCGIFVERTDGCPSILCICHKVWCFKCGTKGARCKCTGYNPAPPSHGNIFPSAPSYLDSHFDYDSELEHLDDLATPPDANQVPHAMPPPGPMAQGHEPPRSYIGSALDAFRSALFG